MNTKIKELISKVNLPFSFMGFDNSLYTYEKSKVVILPVGYDATTSYLSGTRQGPLAIINASRYLECFDAEINYDCKDIGIFTLPFLTPQMSGPEKMIQNLTEIIDSLISDNKFVVLLGGEHTLTVSMANSYLKKYPEMSVLQIDAHLDLRDSYEGTKFNHACAMRRIITDCTVVQAGIRSVCEEENDYINSNNLKPFYSWNIRKDPDWIEKINEAIAKDVYLTIDLDGLDPSIMPSVGTPEPDGLLWHEITGLIKTISQNHNIIGFDVVELCPIPGLVAPDVLAAKLIYRIIGLYSLSKNLNLS